MITGRGDIMIDDHLDCRGMVGPKTGIALVFLSIFTVFILQNTEVVEISFFFWHLSLSRVVLLLGSLFIGVIIGLFIGWEAAAHKKNQN
jgi:uncharacterized integral membrane protein